MTPVEQTATWSSARRRPSPRRPASARPRRARGRRSRRSRCRSCRRPRGARRGAQRSRVTSTGAASTPERVNRAALVVRRVADEQADVERRSRLDARRRRRRRGSPRGSRPRRRRRATCVGRSTQREAKNAAHGSIPPSRRRPNMRLRFCTACDAAPFQRLSIAPKTKHLAGALVGARRGSRQTFVSRTSRTPGGAVGELDERLVGVGAARTSSSSSSWSTGSRRRDVAGDELALVERQQVRRERRRHRRRRAPRAPGRSPARGGGAPTP